MEEVLRQPPLIEPPLMNAAGSLGFAPEARASVPWEAIGAFVTNPISLRSRKPASGTRWGNFPGGILLHSGHPNPGFRQAVKKYAPRWAQASLPVVVHLLASRPEEIEACVVQLEVVENILAVEIGFPESISEVEAIEVISAATGELPLIARVPLTRSIELAPALVQAGASAVSLGPPRGSLQVRGDAMRGRMYGPAVFPLAFQAVRELHEMGVAVIGAGGVYHPQQAEAILQAGALAVQLDLALWRGDWLVNLQG